MAADKQNANPELRTVTLHARDDADRKEAGSDRDAIDSAEVYGHLRGINDPEHPLTLEQLGVVQPDLVGVDSLHHEVRVQFTPTIPHCSMATLIGLCIKVKLARSLPRRYRTSVSITPGSHASEAAINKQLADKERVAAAMENAHLLDVVDRCLDGADPRVDVQPSMAIASEAAEW
ncbi:hypothetical protein FNF27_06370 [Cafeteria roenbergensis]|uniref:MIP18 family-like domain-containing protein n=1 Tax=Cafeteria roenbergensis TaxID=33653 RepID=A0A5A8CFG1_CAFRO|nr:hypothetical protein FNF29_04586 [Cafeteria roenbergensis]KAA0156103.1 hypothetical protein FNF31_06009 [Cafeteria roenbergensis]KAA0164083.1 hypothetical protein FNF28_03996 [Cafeteria roenbergensis]KAA0171251.1 hypothetical protein FNF27_06370 [Cafeteria roenbergensis]|eukprot:KAA0151387.1 hypothetical protein FNF29_04586 [Cafeteria roenbergensis]